MLIYVWHFNQLDTINPYDGIYLVITAAGKNNDTHQHHHYYA